MTELYETVLLPLYFNVFFFISTILRGSINAAEHLLANLGLFLAAHLVATVLHLTLHLASAGLALLVSSLKTRQS